MEERTQETLHEETFVSNGEEFKRTTYNGISVVVDSNGYYRASKICEDNGKRFGDWFKNKDTAILLNEYSRNLGIPIKSGSGEFTQTQNYGNSDTLPLMYKRSAIYNNKTRGWYIKRCLVHPFSYWANIPYAVAVGRLMDLHDEINHLKQQSLQDTIANLTTERDTLKAESEAKDKKIEDLEAKVATLRTPIDNLREDYLYAK